ncbi:hypothetical protein [Bosea sp. RAC05]|uniref:hypothetical protein n=1 Tax=Bosea sp. RAC05 TaxID=1842539 RepID=UPI0008581D2C|nr:hypothetical protein [Bosea sp. RAC05]AOG03246.1 hypothetical protein BSY19_5256 [Bosea sp. RAC05]
MPQRADRPFPAEFVRQGGVISKASVTIRCSRCPTTRVHESKNVLPDEVISKRLKSWGWVLGRNRSHDICPGCAGVTQINRLAGRFKVISDGQEIASPSEIADTVGLRRAQQSREVDALIDRTFGVPVCSSDRTPRQDAAPPDGGHQPGERGSDKFGRIEQAITSLTGDLGQIRAAMELLMEQMGELVGLQQQQVKAIGNLSSVVARSNEGIAVGLNMLGAAVRELGQGRKIPPLPSASSAIEDIELPAIPIRSLRNDAFEGESARRSVVRKPGPAPKAVDKPIVVNSYRDGKNHRKFYTMVQLPKALWEDFGFQGDDRVFIEREDGDTISIRRAEEGGVKLKKVTDTTVTIQTTRIGNVNFEVQRPKGSKGEIYLHA